MDENQHQQRAMHFKVLPAIKHPKCSLCCDCTTFADDAFGRARPARAPVLHIVLRTAIATLRTIPVHSHTPQRDRCKLTTTQGTHARYELPPRNSALTFSVRDEDGIGTSGNSTGLSSFTRAPPNVFRPRCLGACTPRAPAGICGS